MSNQKSKIKQPEASSNNTEIEGEPSDSISITGNGNVINLGGKNTSSNPSSKRTRHRKGPKVNVMVVVAWIGFFATILATLITVYGGKLGPDSLPGIAGGATLSTTEGAAIQTSTSVPVDVATVVTSTAISTATNTPVSLPTPTPIQPVAIGKDWLAGCISTLWKAYPSNVLPIERGDGCWMEPVHAFSAENGDLDFLSERGSGTAEIYGLFAPLPESGTVTFTIRLKDLSNADLWMGVFSEPDVNSRGLLMAILNGDVNKRAIVQKNFNSYETILGTQALIQGNVFSISFTFTTLSASSSVNPNVFVTNPFSIPTAQKWLFLGYKGLGGSYRIEGTFLNFELKP